MVNPYVIPQGTCQAFAKPLALALALTLAFSLTLGGRVIFILSLSTAVQRLWAGQCPNQD
jgi:hypothetical protein